jgi:transcriptional regulator with XRE-family HTH domain
VTSKAGRKRGATHGTDLLGSRLRELRTSRGLTLRDLAKALHMSPSSLSMLENGKCGVGLRRLQRIADHFDVTISSLIGTTSNNDGGGSVALKAYESAATADFVERSKGVWYRHLEVPPQSRLQPFAIRLEPHAGFERDRLAHPGEEFVLVVAGTVELIVGKRRRALEEGEAAHFESSVPHAYRNRGKIPALIVGIASPPW